MRTAGVLSTLLIDLVYRSIGVGIAYAIGSSAAQHIQALYATITTALPG